MESNSQRNRINMSPEAAEALLEQAPDAVLLSRGLMEVKGKARGMRGAPSSDPRAASFGVVCVNGCDDDFDL